MLVHILYSYMIVEFEVCISKPNQRKIKSFWIIYQDRQQLIIKLQVLWIELITFIRKSNKKIKVFGSSFHS